MKLKVLLPTEILLDEDVTKIVAEAENGAFCLLPRHVDFVAALNPGILTYTTLAGEEQYAAHSDGILVKTTDEVRVSVRNGVRGENLGRLRQLVAEQFAVIDDRERVARSAVAKLEADFFRRFLEFGERDRV
ncbi:MAG: F0F1 ATP synthase subunit epsilon [Candidatus Zixiibacteriota bacterium]|nr:MAG: F0F1 ATP synthase subunit epsilon [candidate division Zixibacteria bacterium]